jgi:hypothetical protein
MHLFTTLLDSRHAPRIAAAISLLLGLIFVFVWAPHPWGWRGIDQYHELARRLAAGERFATTDVPWGYAYFVALFYWLFGDLAWIPVTAQVLANATIPLMLYALLRTMAPQRIAALASLLVGALSFNTIYASTLSSDSICTVLFVGCILLFALGHERDSTAWFAASGLLAGTVPQFRPNLILLPGIVAVLYLIVSTRARRRRAVLQMTTFVALAALALSPWVVRNYRLTGAILPTSTHGGVQLWYGTLQVGPYLESRAHNPRSVFGAASFDYTSMANQPIVVTAARYPCSESDTADVDIVFWTDRDERQQRRSPSERHEAAMTFELPGQPAPSTLYYFFETSWRDAVTGERRTQPTPADALVAPFVFFVADDHLRDLDRRADLLDVFDLVRLIRHFAWNEPLTATPADLDGDGRTSESDLRTAVVRLLGDRATDDAYAGLSTNDAAATIRLADESTLTVRRTGGFRVTDLEVRGRLAGSLVSARRRAHAVENQAAGSIAPCRVVREVGVNEVFYRREPHEMRRYMALAADNISRDPLAFLAASVYRMGRLFVIRGTDDPQTTHQFDGSASVYGAGLVLSSAYLLLFFVGVVLGWRRYPQLRALLVPVVYVPLTICFVLTNMRYTVTVQPLMFVFVAVAIVHSLRLTDDSGYGVRRDLPR